MSGPTYGVLGVGSIARAIVIGLCKGIADPPRIVLSPRGVATSAELAARYDAVTVAADNQQVLDDSDVVIVCLRNADASLQGDAAPDFAELSREYATPGGVNEQVARELREHGSFDVLRAALTRALGRLAT